MNRTLYIKDIDGIEDFQHVTLKVESKNLPVFEGKLILVNGYHSDSFGGTTNALFNINPDYPHFGKLNGKNVHDKSEDAHKDVYTQEQYEQDDKREEEIKRLERKHNLTEEAEWEMDRELKNIEKRKELFYGYWNKRENGYKAANLYASYFNAKDIYYVNGSHGLDSSASHRIDRAIAQGYVWAKNHWGIKSKEDVDNAKEKKPHIETYSPLYTPVSIVGHSQGATGAFGFAIGVLHYAAEKGWDAVPINLITLGTHQPTNLTGDEHDDFVYRIRNYYEVNANLFEGSFWLWRAVFSRKDRKVVKYLTRLSQIYNFKHNKCKKERGIYEHLIGKQLNMFGTLKERAIQFTFGNDRPDFTAKDGDIPEIDNACNPEHSMSRYSIEFFETEKDFPCSNYLKNYQKVELPMNNGEENEEKVKGILLIPKYIANQRVKIKKKRKVTTVGLPTNGDFELWEDYKSVAIDWGKAFSKFFFLRKEVEINKSVGKLIEFKLARKKMIYNYGRIQEADLYTHFTPVSLLMNKLLLKDWDSIVPGENLGTKTSIWDRLKELGDDKFYRVNTKYDEEASVYEELDQEEHRVNINDEIKDTEKLIQAQSLDYVKNVINAFVHDDKAALANIYKEPNNDCKRKEAKAYEAELAKKYTF